MKTKQKIIDQAVLLYNKEGFSQVTNQQIAKAAGISLSNLNYHFATKRDLVIALFAFMRQELVEHVYGKNTLVNASNGWEIARRFFEYEVKFKFFYLQTPHIMRSYPGLRTSIQEQFEESIQLIRNLSYMAIGKGEMKPEPKDMPGLYDRLAEQIWLNNHFWLAKSYIRGEDENMVSSGLEAAMSIIYPYLTEKGKSTFQETISEMKSNSVKNHA